MKKWLSNCPSHETQASPSSPLTELSNHLATTKVSVQHGPTRKRSFGKELQNISLQLLKGPVVSSSKILKTSVNKNSDDKHSRNLSNNCGRTSSNLQEAISSQFSRDFSSRLRFKSSSSPMQYDENTMLGFPGEQSCDTIICEDDEHSREPIHENPHEASSSSSQIAKSSGTSTVSSSLFLRKGFSFSSSGLSSLPITSNSSCSMESFLSQPNTSWGSARNSKQSPSQKLHQLLSPSKVTENTPEWRGLAHVDPPTDSDNELALSSISAFNTPLSKKCSILRRETSTLHAFTLEETQTEPFPSSFSKHQSQSENLSGYSLRKKSFSCTMDKENNDALFQSPTSVSQIKRRRLVSNVRCRKRLPSIMSVQSSTSEDDREQRLSLHRSFSTSSALNKSYIDECIRARDDLHLVGDNQTVHSLPIIRHADVLFISIETVAKVLSEEYGTTSSNSFFCTKRCVLLDCRYPYEFDGGHIRGAINVSTQMDLNYALQHLHEERTQEKSKSRSEIILILHCEFSTHRAPSAARRLREEDRKCNHHRYPFLYFPEIYVMDGGYAKFFQQYSHLCEPNGYVTMRDSRFTHELSKFSMVRKNGSFSSLSTPGFSIAIRKRILSITCEEDKEEETL